MLFINAAYYVTKQAAEDRERTKHLREAITEDDQPNSFDITSSLAVCLCISKQDAMSYYLQAVKEINE